MASMSYCKFENTSGDLSRCIDAMVDADELKDLNMSQYELPKFHRLREQCEAFIEEYERLTENT